MGEHVSFAWCERADALYAECIIGVATQKTQDFIKYEEEQKAKERAESTQKDSSIALRRHKYAHHLAVLDTES